MQGSVIHSAACFGRVSLKAGECRGPPLTAGRKPDNTAAKNSRSAPCQWEHRADQQTPAPPRPAPPCGRLPSLPHHSAPPSLWTAPHPTPPPRPAPPCGRLPSLPHHPAPPRPVDGSPPYPTTPLRPVDGSPPYPTTPPRPALWTAPLPTLPPRPALPWTANTRCSGHWTTSPHQSP